MQHVRRSRLLLVFFTVLPMVFLSLSVLSCGGGNEDEGETLEAGAAEKKALAVEAVTVTKGVLLEEIRTSGIVKGKNEAYVTSETRGIIRSVNFELGDRVTPEDVLLKVEDTIPRLNLQQAEQQYETAKIDLNAKEDSYQRGNTSRAALIQARSTYNGAKAQYERSLKALKDTSLTSPITGYVASKDGQAAVGNLLSAGTPVARIVDLSGFTMEVSVGEGEVGSIEAGAEADITVPAACEEKVLTGRVTAVAAGSDPATGSFAVVLSWEDSCAGRIKSGMSARAVIGAREEKPRTIIPASAIISRDEKKWVLLGEDGTAAFREVVVGRGLGNRVEVLEGLFGGETLLLSGLTVLDEGDQVTVTLIGESGSWK